MATPLVRPRRNASVGISLLIALLCSTVGHLQARARKQDASRSLQGAPTAPLPIYPNSPQGLEKLTKEMIKLEKEGQKDALSVYSKSLALPETENWFRSVFGDKLGPPLAVLSERARSQIETGVSDVIAQVVKEKLLNVEVVRFGDECNPLATDAEYRFLIHRVRSEPLYDVRFHDSQKQLIWSYFAYVDGGFRFIGNIRMSGSQSSNADSLSHDKATSSPDAPHRIRVGGNVQQVNLLPGCQTIPHYPSEAKSNHVEGTVILHAIIDKDGEVKELQAIGGPQILIQPAMEAVKRWHYRQTFLNGEPIEVDTTITVIFEIRG